MKTGIVIKLRRLSAQDLERANAVIKEAVMSWGLPDRIKRLSLPSYRCHVHDLEHLRLWGAEDEAGRIPGVAAWEPADRNETPNGAKGLLLHGFYVLPALHGKGIGGRLLDAAIEAARGVGIQQSQTDDLLRPLW